MRKALIVTVGGSHQPILRGIERTRPDFVHFLCSADSERLKGSYTQVSGEGNVLKSSQEKEKPDLPNITKVAMLNPGQFEVHTIEHFDNLGDCYLVSLRLIDRLMLETPETSVIVDFTGGTKSMSAGLAAAALEDGRCRMQMVAGLRQDLRQTADGTEFVRPVLVLDAQAERRMRLARKLIARFDYSGAADELEDTAERFTTDASSNKLQRWISLCRAFDAWDRFDHAQATRLLQPYRGVADNHKTFLAQLGDGRGHGFELVEDLLLNAERRAAQGRYDDAVGRLYRALEMTAQIWLKQKHGLDTSGVNSAAVPDSIRGELEQSRDDRGTIKVGLDMAWRLAGAFPDDPVGAKFADNRGWLLTFLSVRNQSLFAHGRRPIGISDYETHGKRVISFLQEALFEALNSLNRKPIVTLEQLPTDWE